jgi:hypothetical protein
MPRLAGGAKLTVSYTPSAGVDSLWALVRGLGGVVSGDPAECVPRAEQGEQGLGAGAEGVRVGVPVRPHVGEVAGVVLVAGDDQRASDATATPATTPDD